MSGVGCKFAVRGKCVCASMYAEHTSFKCEVPYRVRYRVGCYVCMTTSRGKAMDLLLALELVLDLA